MPLDIGEEGRSYDGLSKKQRDHPDPTRFGGDPGISDSEESRVQSTSPHLGRRCRLRVELAEYANRTAKTKDHCQQHELRCFRYILEDLAPLAAAKQKFSKVFDWLQSSLQAR